MAVKGKHKTDEKFQILKSVTKKLLLCGGGLLAGFFGFFC